MKTKSPAAAKRKNLNNDSAQEKTEPRRVGTKKREKRRSVREDFLRGKKEERKNNRKSHKKNALTMFALLKTGGREKMGMKKNKEPRKIGSLFLKKEEGFVISELWKNLLINSLME